MFKIKPFKPCGFPVKGDISMQAYFYVAVLALDCYIIAVALAHCG